MLFLNQKTVYGISGQSVQSAVEDAYRILLSKEFHMPDRIHVSHRENTLLLMPCFSEKYFATKLVSVFPNAYQKNMPAVNGVLVLCDNASGNPLAVMDGAAITAQRTGAVGGLGVKYLTHPDITTAGIFGAGIQGYFQSRYLLMNRRIKTLYICDLNHILSTKMASMIQNEFKDVKCMVVSNPSKLVESSEVIITATTSTSPLFDKEAVKPSANKTFIGIGSFRPDMQEFPETVAQMADRVFVDTLFAKEESGDIHIPLKKQVIDDSKIETFSSVIEEPERVGKGMFFFKSVGMALFDLTVAAMMYETALEKKMGQQLEK